MAMAANQCRLENLEAAVAFAKLSASEDNRTMLKEAGAIPVLVRLIKETGCPEVKQAVVMALSNLSESASCKCPLVEAGAVSGLLGLVGNPPEEDNGQMYRELETRREGARTLANLAESDASAMVRELGKETIREFMQAVDALRDERLKMHARRLKSRVGVCC